MKAWVIKTIESYYYSITFLNFLPCFLMWRVSRVDERGSRGGGTLRALGSRGIEGYCIKQDRYILRLDSIQVTLWEGGRTSSRISFYCRIPFGKRASYRMNISTVQLSKRIKPCMNSYAWEKKNLK